MTGSDAVLDAALRQSGVLRVDTIEALFDMAEVLAKQPLPAGPRLAIVTNAGGPGALATDALVLGQGGELAELSAMTHCQALNALLPAQLESSQSRGCAGRCRCRPFVPQRCVSWPMTPNVDGVLAVLTPQAMTNPTSHCA
jgi:acetyltransferase